MKTTIKLDSTQYTLCVPDKGVFCTPTVETDMQNRITDVTILHKKAGKFRRVPVARKSTRVFPPNGENVSVREYCEQYYRANQHVFGGSNSFSRETLDFFEPLSVKRCYVQGEYSEEVTA